MGFCPGGFCPGGILSDSLHLDWFNNSAQIRASFGHGVSPRLSTNVINLQLEFTEQWKHGVGSSPIYL